MPCLKRLIYRCNYLIWRGYVDDPSSTHRGVHVERLGRAIQLFCQSLEELVIEVSDVRDLWGHDRTQGWDREEDSDFVVSEGGSDESSMDEFDSDGCSDDVLFLADGDSEPTAIPSSVDEFGEILQSQLAVLTQDAFADNEIKDDSEVLLSEGREPSWDDQCPTFLVSLAAFRRLKTIKVPAMALQDPGVLQWSGRGVTKVLSDWNHHSSMRLRMTDLLPRSLECLTLFRLEMDRISLDSEIEDILTEKGSKFPNLVSVVKQDQPPWCQASQAEQELWQFERFRSHMKLTEEDMTLWGSTMIPANWTNPDRESSPHGGVQE